MELKPVRNGLIQLCGRKRLSSHPHKQFGRTSFYKQDCKRMN